MGLNEELDSVLGDVHETAREAVRKWMPICVCGHQGKAHSPSIGGSYELPPSGTQTVRGQKIEVEHRFHGCCGELAGKGRQLYDTVREGDDRIVHMIFATCPCTQFTAIAEVDRPHRFFNQPRPRDRSDRGRHPFLLGLRAYRTRISRFKAYLDRPEEAAAEFDRRFRWLDGVRICSERGCKETADVWPAFVDSDDRSELRCAKHR